MRSNVTKLFEIWRAEQLDDFDVILPALKQEEQLLDTMQLLYHRWIEAVPDMAHITHSSFDGERRAWGAWDDQYCAWKEALNGLLISGIPLPYAGMPDIPDVTSGTFLEDNIQPAFEHAKQALQTELNAFRIWTNTHRQWAKQSFQILKLRLDCLGKTNVQTKDAETIFLNLQKEREGLAERSDTARKAFVSWRKAHGTWRTLWVQWLHLFTTEKYRQAEKTYRNSLDEDLFWRDESDDANQLYKKYVVGENQAKSELTVLSNSDSDQPAAAVEKKDSAPVCMDDETFGGADEEPADEENWIDEAFDDDEEEDDEMPGDWDADEEELPKSISDYFVTKDRIIRSAQTAIDLIHRTHFGAPEKMPVTDLDALNVLSDLLTIETTSALKKDFPQEAADVELLVLRVLTDAAERSTRMPRRIFSHRDIRVLKSLLRTLFPIRF